MDNTENLTSTTNPIPSYHQINTNQPVCHRESMHIYFHIQKNGLPHENMKLRRMVAEFQMSFRDGHSDNTFSSFSLVDTVAQVHDNQPT
jgi:hypothetical protein